MGVFYELTTFHQTVLGVRASSGVIENATEQARAADWAALTAFISDRVPNVCILIARPPIEPTLKIGQQQFHRIVPLRALRSATGVLSLYDPANGMHLCASPPDVDSGVGGVSLDRRAIGEWERFTVRALRPFYLGDDVVRLGAALEEFLESGLHAESLIRWVRREPIDPATIPIIEAAVRLMPPAQLAFAAAWVLHAPGALRRVARLYPDDFDAAVALPRLRAWLDERQASLIGGTKRARADGQDTALAGGKNRRGWFGLFHRGGRGGPRESVPIREPAGEPVPPAPQRLGPELDFLAHRGEFGDDVSFPHVCNALLRQSVPPRRDVCIVATARDEGLYLLEWIAYHRLIGVQSFFLYSNFNSDGSDPLLAALHKAGVITAISNETVPGADVQRKAYGHALSALPDTLDFRWTLLLDLDEFFTFDPGRFGSILDYIHWQETQSVHAIALNWLVLTSGGEISWRDEPVTRRFVTEIGGAGPLVKCLSRPQLFIHSGPHFPAAFRQAPFIFRNSDRDLHQWQTHGFPALSDNPIANHAWINHYFFKSAEEFLCKWARGRADTAVNQPTNQRITADFVKQFVDQHVASSRLGPAREARAIQDCAPDLDAEIARLMALPGVAAAAEAIKTNFCARIGGLVEMFADAPGIIEAGEAGRQFLGLFAAASRAAVPARQS